MPQILRTVGRMMGEMAKGLVIVQIELPDYSRDCWYWADGDVSHTGITGPAVWADTACVM